MPCSKCKKSGHNKRSCKEEEPSDTAIEMTPPQPPSPPTYTADTLPEELWVCAACNRPLGNDHRMCLFNAFDCDVSKWEQGCRENGLQRLKNIVNNNLRSE